MREQFAVNLLLVVCQSSAPRESFNQTFEPGHAFAQIGHTVTQPNNVTMKVPEKPDDGNANPDRDVIGWVHGAIL